MKSASWKDTAEFVGITAIVLSLIFVGLQIRQSQQIAIEEVINNSNERQNAIRELIVANADIWHRACLGEPLDPAERVIAARIYGAWRDHVFGEYVLRRDGVRQSDLDQREIIEEVVAQHWIYPGLDELRRSRSNWHNGAVGDWSTSIDDAETERFVKRAEELRSSDIERTGDTAWCGSS